MMNNIEIMNVYESVKIEIGERGFKITREANFNNDEVCILVEEMRERVAFKITYNTDTQAITTHSVGDKLQEDLMFKFAQELVAFMQTARFLVILRDARQKAVRDWKADCELYAKILSEKEARLRAAQESLAEVENTLNSIETKIQPDSHPSHFEKYTTATTKKTVVSLTYFPNDDMFEVIVFYADGKKSGGIKVKTYQNAQKRAKALAKVYKCSWTDAPALYWIRVKGFTQEEIQDRMLLDTI